MAAIGAIANPRPKHHRHARGSGGHVVDIRGLEDELTHRERKKFTERDLDDRALAEHSGANGCSHHRRLADWRFPNPAGSELLEQALRPIHRPTKNADVLTDQKDVLVEAHFGGD